MSNNPEIRFELIGVPPPASFYMFVFAVKKYTVYYSVQWRIQGGGGAAAPIDLTNFCIKILYF